MIYQIGNCEPSIKQFSFPTIPKESFYVCVKGGKASL